MRRETLLAAALFALALFAAGCSAPCPTCQPCPGGQCPTPKAEPAPPPAKPDPDPNRRLRRGAVTAY